MVAWVAMVLPCIGWQHCHTCCWPIASFTGIKSNSSIFLPKVFIRGSWLSLLRPSQIKTQTKVLSLTAVLTPSSTGGQVLSRYTARKYFQQCKATKPSFTSGYFLVLQYVSILQAAHMFLHCLIWTHVIASCETVWGSFEAHFTKQYTLVYIKQKGTYLSQSKQPN